MRNYAALLALVPLVAGHGFIKSPPPRKPGTAFQEACGLQPFYQQSSDINGNVQGILQVVGSDFNAAECNLWQCKGFQFGDNKDNVQSFTLGQTIDFDINIAAPHTGVANVSVVSTSTNSVIGSPLISFTNYASNSGVDANNTAFSVTLPSTLGGDCTTAGDCVLQWFWDARDIDQTYESCVDFTVGAGSGDDTPATTAEVSTTAAATTAAATTAVVPTTAAAITTSIVPIVPTTTFSSIVIIPTPSANGTVTTPPPTSTTDLPDDECPGDDDEDDGDDGDDDDDIPDDECPGDDGDDDEDDSGDDLPDDECPGDDDEDDGSSGETGDDTGDDSDPVDTATSTKILAQPTGTAVSTVTQVVTVTAAPVTITATVTAAPTACA